MGGGEEDNLSLYKTRRQAGQPASQESNPAHQVMYLPRHGHCLLFHVCTCVRVYVWVCVCGCVCVCVCASNPAHQVIYSTSRPPLAVSCVYVCTCVLVCTCVCY